MGWRKKTRVQTQLWRVPTKKKKQYVIIIIFIFSSPRLDEKNETVRIEKASRQNDWYDDVPSRSGLIERVRPSAYRSISSSDGECSVGRWVRSISIITFREQIVETRGGGAEIVSARSLPILIRWKQIDTL